MPVHYARNAYLQAKIQPETDPKRLILMLYEGVLEDLRLAREGIVESNATKRGEHLSRAVAIVSTLLSSLDTNAVDESITFLRGLYESTLLELAKVAVNHDIAVLDLAFRYLERLKQIWEHDVMGLHAPAPEVSLQEQVQTTVQVAAPTMPPRVLPRLGVYGATAGAARRTFSV